LFLTHRRSASRAPTPPVKSLALIGFPEPDRWPKISIIIPTRDRVALLRECLDSLKTTAYPGIFEIVVIDNDSTEAETADYLAAKTANESISVVRVPGPFNFSRLNNAAVEHVTGEFICLLNNDVTVIDADWLTALVTVAVGDNVGAVGPMLLYPDGTIQHAGVAIGLGNAAGHVQRGVEPATRIHATWTRSTRRVSAVTAACLLVRRSDYLVVGGLDEADFPVAFNDVDFCLKLQEIGHRNVYVACTALYHHESKSRGSDLAPSNIERFSGELARLKRKWHTEHCQDPWFSPMFSKASERCVLSFLPPT
jgi:GT2 family glycosyltransferase